MKKNLFIQKHNKNASLSSFFVEFMSILAFIIFIIAFNIAFLHSCSSNKPEKLFLSSVKNPYNFYLFTNQQLLNQQIPIEKSVFNPNEKGTINLSLREAIPILVTNCYASFHKPNAQDDQCNILKNEMISNDNAKSCFNIKTYNNPSPIYSSCKQNLLYHLPLCDSHHNSCVLLLTNISSVFGKFYLTNSHPLFESSMNIKKGNININLIHIGFGDYNFYISHLSFSSISSTIESIVNNHKPSAFAFIIPITYINNTPINYSVSVY
ncbi:MAG: hypothetical protein GWP09_01255 [Nitrospiraceae bacterium]|nr:hypothetical protein [Nitrospiraceae bacterium]